MPHEPPEPGYLLNELGYFDEPETAAALAITPKTLIEYRKQGIGPVHIELARKIMYSRAAIAEWLAAGGTRAREIVES
ncbi:helix-turn-helix domain-containing protein [Bradyrhizobium lablabi]|uniref:helix-turn-helix domain-containing protein n=1 Tax=Bradyrhizobium lablabi TaxID=722472 RepID=UPI001BA9A5AF|nr:helix-turn-helix domain-containing protein [Bradyrhizobium lablabi]MBR0695214.1 helix-turn-helix domain-containing protein [Bradyrhizobium lablabi]